MGRVTLPRRNSQHNRAVVGIQDQSLGLDLVITSATEGFAVSLLESTDLGSARDTIKFETVASQEELILTLLGDKETPLALLIGRYFDDDWKVIPAFFIRVEEDRVLRRDKAYMAHAIASYLKVQLDIR